ncbi:MAG TPA: hypothetical protein VEA78_02830 [Acidimicrobiales bacterium]|nr:hypothetical protein [Acidimicrobiales bacterium]
MRKLQVRNEALPGIGDLFELVTAAGGTLTIVTHRSGRRDLSIGGGDQPAITTPLTRGEAAGVAALLSGAHVELTTSPRRS